MCPGNKINFYATVGNDSSISENLQAVIYADSDTNAYHFPTSGPRSTFSFTVNRGEFSFPVFYEVPGPCPRT